MSVQATEFESKLAPFFPVKQEGSPAILIGYNLNWQPLPSTLYVDLPILYDLAASTLKKVITPQRISASADPLFNADFGRDSRYTLWFILEAEKNLGVNVFSESAVQAVLSLDRFQGRKYDRFTSEEKGLPIHEARAFGYEHLTTERIKMGQKPFFVDKDGVVKLWQSADVAALAVILKHNLWQQRMISLDQPSPLRTLASEGQATPVFHTQEEVIKANLEWILDNIASCGGLPGFFHQRRTPYAQLWNKHWADSEFTLRHRDGRKGAYPRKPVEIAALDWAALLKGAEMFDPLDYGFAKKLREAASNLREVFNSSHGFLMPDPYSGFYFAEFVDGKKEQGTNVTINPALAFWASYQGECIIDQRYRSATRDRIMHETMLNPHAGVSVYSRDSVTFHRFQYHSGPDVVWYFINQLVAAGMIDMGYEKEGTKVSISGLYPLQTLHSCAELTICQDKQYRLYYDPANNQESCHEQAWTAGAIYHAITHPKILEAISTINQSPESLVAT